MAVRITNWSTRPTFGGTPMTSRYTQQRIAATDHCVAIVRRCANCHETFVATPEQPEHDCVKFVANAFVRAMEPLK